MDARLLRGAVCLATLLVISAPAGAGEYRTANFVVTAPTDEIAEQVGKTAEFYRDYLAEQWLGKRLPRWYKPCTISVKVGQMGAGGATTFSFDRGEVFGWRMTVQGSLERILDSVIPHEVNHTIFACHFRRPLPRWADEGAATLIEHESERHRQLQLLNEVWGSRQQIPLAELLQMTEYPSDMRQVLTLYAQGYSLADFLVQSCGRTRFLQFIEDAHQRGWDYAIERHYGLKNVAALEGRWGEWVMAGSPRIDLPEGQQLASAEPNDRRSAPAADRDDLVIRSQSPTSPLPAAAAAVGTMSSRARNASAPAPQPTRPLANSAATGSSVGGSPLAHRPEAGNAVEGLAGDRRAAAVAGWETMPQDRRPRPAPLGTKIPYNAPQGGRELADGTLSGRGAQPRNFSDFDFQPIDEPQAGRGLSPQRQESPRQSSGDPVALPITDLGINTIESRSAAPRFPSAGRNGSAGFPQSRPRGAELFGSQSP